MTFSRGLMIDSGGLPFRGLYHHLLLWPAKRDFTSNGAFLKCHQMTFFGIPECGKCYVNKARCATTRHRSVKSQRGGMSNAVNFFICARSTFVVLTQHNQTP